MPVHAASLLGVQGLEPPSPKGNCRYFRLLWTCGLCHKYSSLPLYWKNNSKTAYTIQKWMGMAWLSDNKIWWPQRIFARMWPGDHSFRPLNPYRILAIWSYLNSHLLLSSYEFNIYLFSQYLCMHMPTHVYEYPHIHICPPTPTNME